MKTLETMLGLINPAALPALRIAGALFIIFNLAGGVYLFLNRHRFFGRDPRVEDDVPAVRHLRFEVVFIPWLALTALLVVMYFTLWID